MTGLIKFEEGALASSSIDMIAAVEAETAFMLEKRTSLRKELRDAMEAYGVKKIDTKEFTVTFIDGVDREVFMKDQLRDDMPEVYDAYVAMTPVASSIRVKLRNEVK